MPLTERKSGTEVENRCPICGRRGHLAYRCPDSPLTCDQGHYFKNIEGDPRKPHVFAVVRDDDCSRNMTFNRRIPQY